jgi:hypothetical protein
MTEGRAEQIAGGVLLGVGVAAFVTSLGLGLLDQRNIVPFVPPPSPSEQRVERVAPWLAISGLALSAVGIPLLAVGTRHVNRARRHLELVPLGAGAALSAAF